MQYREDIVKELTDGAGYVLLRGVLTPAQIARARAAVITAANDTHFETEWVGRRKRVTELLGLDDVFLDILGQFPQLNECEALLGKDFICGSFHALALFGGQDPQTPIENETALHMRGMHTDYPFGHNPDVPRPKQWTCQVIWMLDDFSEANGGTYIVPHSQKFGRACRSGFYRGGTTPNADDAEFLATGIHVTGKAGDVMFYVGQMWHQSGINTTPTPRVAVLGQFIPYYFAPMEAHAFVTPLATVAKMSPHLLQLLGYTFRHPQRFGGRRRGFWQGTQFSRDALAQLLNPRDVTGTSKSRTEQPLNSAQSSAWWAAAGGLVLAGAGVFAVALDRRPPQRLLVATAAGGGALLFFGTGFVFGSLATLQRLWF